MQSAMGTAETPALPGFAAAPAPAGRREPGALSMRAVWYLVMLAAAAYPTALVSPLRIDLAPSAYLLIYGAFETFSIVALCLVFAFAWNERRTSLRQIALACSFLGGAMLTALYLYSHTGPYSVFAGGETHTSGSFWWAARVLVACGLLSTAFLPNERSATPAVKWFAVGATVATVVAVALAEWHWQGHWPLPWVEWRAAPVGWNAAALGILLVAVAMGWWRRHYSSERPALFAAYAVAACAELVFVTQAPMQSTAVVFGHTVEAAAYYLAYRALFVVPLTAPLARIEALQREADENDERWRHALQAAGHGVFDWDVVNNRIFRSQAYGDMLGYSRAELDAMPPGLDALIDPLEQARIRAVVTDLLQGRGGQFAEVTRMQAKDGSARWLLVRGTVMRCGAGGQPLRVVGTVTDLTERKALEDKLERTTRDLRALLAREQREVQDERKRIAQALHDDLGQHLVAMRMETARLADQGGDPDAQRETAARLDQVIDGAREAVRRAIANLRPAALDELGLVAAVGRLVDQWGRRHGQQTNFVSTGSWDDVPEPLCAELFRIATEALNNVAAHAASRSVHVALMRGANAVTLSIADDGCGLPPDAQHKPAHYGLFGISERVRHLGGTMELNSAPGRGTELSVTLPLAPVS